MDNNTQSTTEPKKKPYTSWAAIAVGVLMILAGTFSWVSDDEETNNALIQAGTAQACTVVVQEYPEAKPYLIKLSTALEAAIEARMTSPAQLANVVSATLSDLTGQGINVDALVTAMVAKINKAHATSETEEQYINKVRIIINGIKDSVN